LLLFAVPVIQALGSQLFLRADRVFVQLSLLLFAVPVIQELGLREQMQM